MAAFFLLAWLPWAAHSAPPIDEVAEAQRLQHFVLAHVQGQMGEQGWADDTTAAPIVDVKIDTARLRRYLNGQTHSGLACSHPEFSLPGLSPSTRLRTHWNVVVRCAQQGSPLSIPVMLRLLGTWPVAARPLPPGHTLSEADIRLHHGDLLRLPPGTVIHTRDLIGQTTTQRIAARQLFKHNTLRSAHAVTRGQPLTLQIRTPAYTLTGSGAALQDGEPGQRIHARNAAGQPVQGRLLNAHTLVVED